jgi:transposase, IS30 family
VNRRSGRIPEDVREEVIRLAGQGLSQAQILQQVDVSAGTVSNVLRPLGKVQRQHRWEPGRGRLSQDERLEIRFGLEQGCSFRAIAGRLGRSPSTVSREVERNGGREGYRPFAAHDRAYAQSRRPKQTKLATHPQLRAKVEEGLRRLWSPQQIAQRLQAEFGDDPDMHISHETIYQSLYVQGRGELRRELARCLRTGRAKRKPHGRLERRGKIPDKVMISERPAEAAAGKLALNGPVLHIPSQRACGLDFAGIDLMDLGLGMECLER